MQHIDAQQELGFGMISRGHRQRDPHLSDIASMSKRLVRMRGTGRGCHSAKRQRARVLCWFSVRTKSALGGFGMDARFCAGGLPWRGIPALKETCMRIAGAHHVMASACVRGPIFGH